MPEETSGSPRSDDAEIRGEHNYTQKREDAAAPTAEQIQRQRKEGQYSAGADGTQSVSGHPVPPAQGEEKSSK
jgi:hypothetical protein